MQFESPLDAQLRPQAASPQTAGEQQPLLQRPNLSEDLAEHLRGWILDRVLDSGERVNEVHVASRLGVSRTPVREALTRLAGEGFVVHEPRRGFFVRRPDAREIEELYLIRAILDPAALELAGLPGEEQLQQLDQLNRAIAEAEGEPARIIELDDRWHRCLLAHCPNRLLLQLIDQMIARTRPFEHAYMREPTNVRTVVKEHQRVQDAARAGKLSEACLYLRQNLQTATTPIAQALGDNATSTAPEAS